MRLGLGFLHENVTMAFNAYTEPNGGQINNCICQDFSELRYDKCTTDVFCRYSNRHGGTRSGKHAAVEWLFTRASNPA